MTDKTLFVKVGGDYQWTGEQIEDLTEKIGDVVDDGVQVIAVPDIVEYVTSDQLQDFADQISEIANND